jgi:O-antigen/teichoic acid export membrane protein
MSTTTGSHRRDLVPHGPRLGLSESRPATQSSEQRLPGAVDGGHPVRARRRIRTGSCCPAADLAICPLRPDLCKQARQEAGIAALLAIAAQVSMAMSEASTAITPAPHWPSHDSVNRLPSRDVRDAAPSAVKAAVSGGPFSLLQARLRADHLVRNSLYLILSSGLQASLGFGFWIIMARLFSTENVGEASSLISATVLISYLALFGLNNTLVRYLPIAPDRNRLITTAFCLVAACAAGIGLVYVLLTPIIAPRLAFIEHNPAFAAGFMLLAAGAAINLLTDSVFIASRKAGYCALTDGGVGGVSKIVAGVLLASTGAYGLFCASVGGFLASALVSVVLIIVVLRCRPSFRQPFRTLQPVLRFSGANYAGNIFNLLPTLVVPLIVLDRLGSHAAAYYFVAYQMATILYMGAYAVEQAFLAEGSHSDVEWREIRRRSRRLVFAFCLPGCLVLAIASHWVLQTFGTTYSQHGTRCLILLASAVLPIAANNWSCTVLRLAGRLWAIVVSGGIYAVGICGAAWLLAPHGLTALSAAWPIGSSLAASVAMVAVAFMPHKAPRHRRTRTAPTVRISADEAAGRSPVRRAPSNSGHNIDLSQKWKANNYPPHRRASSVEPRFRWQDGPRGASTKMTYPHPGERLA